LESIQHHAATSSDERDIRAARNQAMFRAVNDKIHEVNESFAVLTDTFSIACECANPHCVEIIEIAPSEYEAIRANPRRFAVLPGHEDKTLEHVVAEADGYVVTEKEGKAAETAAALAHPEGDDGG